MTPSTRAIARLKETASQTGGPFVHIGLAPQQAGFDIFERTYGHELAAPGSAGHIVVEGVVYDGSGTPIRDLLIELWQADAQGHYAHPADPKPSVFRGWGRTGADFDSGVWRFDTIMTRRRPTPAIPCSTASNGKCDAAPWWHAVPSATGRWSTASTSTCSTPTRHARRCSSTSDAETAAGVTVAQTKRANSFGVGPCCTSGAAGRIRTHDPLVRSQVLYPTELQPLSLGS
jgi:hypothetical protein